MILAIFFCAKAKQEISYMQSYYENYQFLPED